MPPPPTPSRLPPPPPSPSSFMAVKLNHLPPSFSDDFCTVGDDVFVDGLLDFSTDGGFVEDDDNSQVLTHTHETNDDKASSVSPIKIENEDKTTLPETELCFPVDDVANLEWVSKIIVVDDSFAGGYSSTSPEGTFPERKPETETVTLVAVNPLFKHMVHKKARSKRSRTDGHVWSLRSSSLVTDSSTSCSSSSSCTSKPLLALPEVLVKPLVKRIHQLHVLPPRRRW